MRSISDRSLKERPTALWCFVQATLTAGTLDICAAIVTWLVQGVQPAQVLRGVASGLLGRAAFVGGAGTAGLGLLLHFLIMCGIVAIYQAGSRKLGVLEGQWPVAGVMLGIIVYAAMTYVVVPLSAAPLRYPSSLAVVGLGLAVHVTCVGLPIAFITRRSRHMAASARPG